MQRISRASDNIFCQANEYHENVGEYDTPPIREPYDESFTDDQFSKIYNLYHEGHQLGTHHREVHDWLSENDPLAAVEEAHRQKGESDINQMAVALISKKNDHPEHVQYAMPSWYSKGYQDGRGGVFHHEGLRPFKGGWRYDPPTPEDPMRRNGPW